MQKIGVAASLSRPLVSNDNPFSESLFKTIQYGPMFSQNPFDSIEDARGEVVKPESGATVKFYYLILPKS